MKLPIKTIWDELENPAIESIATLYSWGLNYDHQQNPFYVFCDIIGWSEEYTGDKLNDGPVSLDYVSSDYFAKALTDYAHKPDDVSNYIAELIRLSWDD
jgi:hypothetical protein